MAARLTYPFLVAVLALGGCGRIGFDREPIAAGDRGGDGGGDGGGSNADAGVDGGRDAGGGTGSTAFRDLCAFRAHAIIENGIPADDGVGAQLSSALAAGCDTAISGRTLAQSGAGVLDGDGRPLVSPDELVVLGGGDGPHRAVRYLLESDTPVVWSGASIATYEERETGRIIATGPISGGHDYLLLMVVTERVGDTRALSAQGMGENGTIAAGFYFEKRVAPMLDAHPFSWMLVEWTDVDGDGASDADTFALIDAR